MFKSELYILSCILLIIKTVKPELLEILKWKQIEFEYPSPNGTSDFVFPEPHLNPMFDYIPYNNIPMGISCHKNLLFITIPRRREGIPATLNCINLDAIKSENRSPKLTAYPNYLVNSLKLNFQPDSSKIISVYRTSVDNNCNRLWFVDTGMLEYPSDRKQIQPPSIWIINLNNNQVIRKFQIPANIVADGRGLASITVDVLANSCNNAYAYIPDLFLYGLYVYSFSKNKMWKFEHNYFSFDPLVGDLEIANQTFQWNDGIFSITLGNMKPDGFRDAYFHPMISNSEFAVSTEILQNEEDSARSWHGNDFMHLGTRGNLKQSTIHAFDPSTDIIFYAEISRNGVGCWNTKKVFSANNHGNVQNDSLRMIYPSDLTIDGNGNLWMMTNSMPVFIYSKLNINEFNFRVWKQNTKILSQNTVCEI